MKRRSKLLKLGMKLLMLPVNILATATSLLVIIIIRSIKSGKELNLKIESLEKGNYKTRRL